MRHLRESQQQLKDLFNGKRLLTSMQWQTKAKVLSKNHILGDREAQIYVLSQRGLNANEIQKKLETVVEEPPTTQSIRATKSNAKKKSTQIKNLHQIINGEVEAQPPIYSENQERAINLQIYLGEIGSGKTVTAKTHVSRLLNIDSSQQVIIVDPLGSWTNPIFDDNDQVTLYTGNHALDQKQIANTILHAIEKWERLEEDVELVIDHSTTAVADERVTEAFQDLQNTSATGTVRIIAQLYDPDRHIESISPTQIHYHKILTESIPDPLRDKAVGPKGKMRKIARLTKGIRNPADSAEVITHDCSGKETHSKMTLTGEEEGMLI